MEQRPATEPHNYVFSMAGRCGRCQTLEADHVKVLDQPDPMTECPVDHRSVSTSLLVGERGLEWRRCPFCHVMVEGALRTGEVIGPPYGKGRGDVSPSYRRYLEGMRGWYEERPGDFQ